MNAAATPVLRDDDLVEMLIGEPQLLALADALVVTNRTAREVEPAGLPRRRTRQSMAAAAIAAVCALLAALLLVSPWQRSPSIVDKAFAAVGGGPVLHVVVSQPAEFGGPLVNLKSGKPIPRTLQTEMWFDNTRNIKKTILRLDGDVLDEQLETGQGGWSRAGRIYTCAWIAAHPVEATRAGVSCNPSGANGTTPRVVPENPPTLEPALAGFVDNYRTALASGEAKEMGRGVVEGREVVWLQFSADRGAERVAIDAQTYLPLLIEKDGQPAYHVVAAEALPFDEGYFTKPERLATQSGGSVTALRDLTQPEAASVLGSRAQWLGETWNGLRLTRVTLEERAVGYGPGQEPGRVQVLRLRYEVAGAAEGTSSIDIYEAARCVLSVGWTCTPRDPTSTGTAGLFGFITLVRSQGLYISIWDPGRLQEPLELARALVPMGGATP